MTPHTTYCFNKTFSQPVRIYFERSRTYPSSRLYVRDFPAIMPHPTLRR